MLNAALDHLRASGVEVTVLQREPKHIGGIPDALIEISVNGGAARFAVEQRRRAPYPNEVPQLDIQLHKLADLGQPLLLAPYVPEPIGQSLTKAGWSWADEQGNFDVRGPGLLLRQRRTFSPPKHNRRQLPRGAGSWGVMRSLIAFGESEKEQASAAGLANQARVTPARASQVLSALADLDLVRRTERGRWCPDREALLDRFLAEYPGPRGSERYMYSLDPPLDAAFEIARRYPQDSFVISADVGPDLVAAWRRPSVVIVYVTKDFRVDRLGLVEGRHASEANLIVREPLDTSVFPVPSLIAEAKGVKLPLADVTQMIWDLEELGGADRLEAAGRLRAWSLTRH